jgi:hypothetical protein
VLTPSVGLPGAKEVAGEPGPLENGLTPSVGVAGMLGWGAWLCPLGETDSVLSVGGMGVAGCGIMFSTLGEVVDAGSALVVGSENVGGGAETGVSTVIFTVVSGGGIFAVEVVTALVVVSIGAVVQPSSTSSQL